MIINNLAFIRFEDGSISQFLAAQAWGPEFGSQEFPQKPILWHSPVTTVLEGLDRNSPVAKLHDVSVTSASQIFTKPVNQLLPEFGISTPEQRYH